MTNNKEIEQRLKRVDAALAKQLQTSMSFNTRMTIRLKDLQKNIAEDVPGRVDIFEAIDSILNDKDPA